MTILGLDPGAAGALALLNPDGSIVRVADMPCVRVPVGKSSRDRVEAALLADLIRRWAPDHAIVERVNGRPSDGPVWAFAFGYGAGIAEGVLATLGVPVTFVQPAEWRKAMGVQTPPGADYKARKEASRMRALMLWPDKAPHFARKLDSDRAEACLLARWGILCAGLGALAGTREAA